MRPALPLLLSLFAGTLFAQQAEPGKVPPMTFPTPERKLRQEETRRSVTAELARRMCPVGIAAEPHGTPQSVWVAAVEDATLRSRLKLKTGVHVRLSSRAHAMQAVTVAVDFRELPSGLVPVDRRPRLLQQKTFELTGEDVDAFSRNLLLGVAVDIERIRVLKVLYADGTTWEPERTDTCSVRPSHLVLAAAL